MLPNCDWSVRCAQEHCDTVDMQLTFSKPKNLSLPSSRNGPASWSSFSKGVGGGAPRSFFALLAAVDDDP